MSKNIIRLFYKFLLRPLYKKFNKIDVRINTVSDVIYRVLSYKEYSVNHKRNKVIYTCITGNYDSIVHHEYINFDYDYICFTDNKDLLQIGSYGVWKVKPLRYNEHDNVRNNRWHKIHPHVLFPGYTESIYIDGNINVRTDLYFNLIREDDIMRIPIHGGHDCIYKEGKVIAKSGRDTKENVSRMLDFLTKEKFPEHYGLNENCIIYRKHNDEKIIKMMDMWWKFIKDYSKRDQLSLSYILWKFNIKPENIALPNPRYNDDNFVFYGKHQ
jgi:hypothetical protein